jgi:hypothetical protein
MLAPGDPQMFEDTHPHPIQGMRAMARLKSDRRALRQVARIAWLFSTVSPDVIINILEKASEAIGVHD